jgi:hypothetical protein
MDWENERYVRVYTRDTIAWVTLGWEAQALFLMLIRKVDRSGVIEVGKHGPRGIAGLIGMPIDLVERSLPILLSDGCVAMSGDCILIPNFIEAQEAKQSDRQRQKECRDRRRAEARSRDVTKTSQIVTDSHVRSQPVTVGHSLSPQPSQPSLAVPNEPDSSARARSNPPANDPGKPTPHGVARMFLAIRGQTLGSGGKGISDPFANPSAMEIEKAERWLSAMTEEETQDIEPAIRLACKHILDGAKSWTHPSITDAGFLFGAIVHHWRDLREELHNCAPKAPKTRDKERPPSTPIREW